MGPGSVERLVDDPHISPNISGTSNGGTHLYKLM